MNFYVFNFLLLPSMRVRQSASVLHSRMRSSCTDVHVIGIHMRWIALGQQYIFGSQIDDFVEAARVLADGHQCVAFYIASDDSERVLQLEQQVTYMRQNSDILHNHYRHHSYFAAQSPAPALASSHVSCSVICVRHRHFDQRSRLVCSRAVRRSYRHPLLHVLISRRITRVASASCCRRRIKRRHRQWSSRVARTQL
jgi:hypothetical protein